MCGFFDFRGPTRLKILWTLDIGLANLSMSKSVLAQNIAICAKINFVCMWISTGPAPWPFAITLREDQQKTKTNTAKTGILSTCLLFTFGQVMEQSTVGFYICLFVPEVWPSWTLPRDEGKIPPPPLSFGRVFCYFRRLPFHFWPTLHRMNFLVGQRWTFLTNV